MQQIYSNLDSFTSKYESSEKLSPVEKLILKNYFERGGLIKTASEDKLKVIYPDKTKIKRELELIKRDMEIINEECKAWEKTKRDAEKYISSLKIKKYYDKTYWKHLYKALTDKQYKEDFEKAKLPIEMVADPKMKKIIQEFLENNDYRNNLLETLSNSIVYQNRNIGEQVVESIKMKEAISEKKLELFYRKRNILESQMKAYKIISRWVVE